METEDRLRYHGHRRGTVCTARAAATAGAMSRPPPARRPPDAVDDAEGLHVAVERCPLCSSTRRRLTCASCVRSGSFLFFDGRDAESFAEKRARLAALQAEVAALRRAAARRLEGRLSADTLRWRASCCRGRLQQLREATAGAAEALRGRAAALREAGEERQRLQRRARRHLDKAERIRRHNARLGALLQERGRGLQARRDQLAALRRGHVLQLTAYIFPLCEARPGPRGGSTVRELADASRSTERELAEAAQEGPGVTGTHQGVTGTHQGLAGVTGIHHCLAGASSTLHELTEANTLHELVKASRTHHGLAGASNTLHELAEASGTQHGLTGTLHELAEATTLHKLADSSRSTQMTSTLTSSTVHELAEASRTTYQGGRWASSEHSADVSITGPWITLPGNGDYAAYYHWVEEKKSTEGPDLEPHNPAYTISAALCFATQLVNTLSHILDVNLPRKLSNAEFCCDNLNRRKFTRAVNKLNANVLYLCFSQQVHPDVLHPLHTLRNLWYLLSPDTENLGRSGPFELSADLEDSMEFVDPSDSGDTDDSGDEHISDGEADVGTDWENLSPPRFCDMPSHTQEMLQSTQLAMPSASSSAGGMISSAAASVTSWLKAYTGHR